MYDVEITETAARFLKLQKLPIAIHLLQLMVRWQFLRASGIKFLRVLGNQKISDISAAVLDKAE